MREIILDTETTGLDPKTGDRIVEIACLEVFDCIPTGRTYQQYINPLRAIPPEASRVSGLTTEFVAKFPVFEEIVDDFLNFIGDDVSLVIHNAPFDIGFLNMELEKSKRKIILKDRVIDTLKLARETVRTSRYSLDALCEKFNIDRSKRIVHGALIDCELLAQVYLELRGGRQRSLFESSQEEILVHYASQTLRVPRTFPSSEDEKSLHAEALKEIKNPLWISLEMLP